VSARASPAANSNQRPIFQYHVRLEDGAALLTSEFSWSCRESNQAQKSR